MKGCEYIMAEAIITRAAGEPESTLPISPIAHTVEVTVKLGDNRVIANCPVSCKDGSTYYNYKTNEKGKVLFMANSGAANIFVNNVINGTQFIDFIGNSINIDAPVGLSTRVNLTLQNGGNYFEYTSSRSFGILAARNVDLTIVGGGGGGGSGCGNKAVNARCGAGGGAGYMNNYNGIIMGPVSIYNFKCGAGGLGGHNPPNSSVNGNNGTTGATSYIENTSYFAIGGTGGGGANLSGDAPNGGVGGLGNGAGRIAGYYLEEPEDSPVDFAGGGGGAFHINDLAGFNENEHWRGLYYGGGYDYNYNLVSASRGGGGCGGYNYYNIGNWNNETNTRSSGYNGGSGLMRINIHY